MPRSVRILSLGILAPLMLPSLAHAQAGQRAMYELPTLSIEMAQKTPRSEQAMGLFDEGKWKEAAQLYETAAKAAPVNSVDAYQAYDMAARIYFYGHDYPAARGMMEKAANVAQATGDVVSAAYRHVDAAFIAVWEGYPGSRREHVQKAEELAKGSGVPPADKARIDALIQGVRTLPVTESHGG